ncbi:efflux transporter outer membrane subunit [Aurantiacibacter spongiae]|uniref:Efflux transporter outer membrane subunit n=1 Tax=Aurantiacibacter spongiae TaxID=2488860 RepID=A0A3N5DPB0_9SPHN|nr:efflux transporter outer membrane subunit [Aurantiacibacter spongiae]RPF70951.1 efflux transporter outer membrane subunit [Aurantiacibacter spongiae]
MIARAALLASAFSLAGCAGVDPVVLQPDIAPPRVYATDLPPAGLDREWWTGFGDPVLSDLVEQGLAANLDVDAAAGRLVSAAALLRAERADRLPSIDGTGDAGISLGTDSELTATAGLFGLFNPDIDGRLAAEIRATAADYAEAEYLLADQRRLVAAAVASQYIEYRRTGAQLDLLEQSTGLQEQTLRIVTLRYEAGLAANLDVRRAAADLAQTRARRGLIEISRANALNALAVLLAAPPGVFRIPPPAQNQEIPDYGAGPAAGVPADLLRRRTDILAAEARLARAAADIGIEQADLRPLLTIPGSIGLGDGTLGGLFGDFLLGLGAAIDLPIFDGGRRRAEVDAAEGLAQARLAEYRTTFLDALGEVENALVAIQAYRQRNGALTEAIDQSETALSQSNALYREGLASLFDVLDAQRQLIASRQALIDSEAALASSFVSFHAAVGSDW